MRTSILQKNNCFTFGIDFDDVLAPFNVPAVELANQEHGLSLTIEDITCWEHTEKTKCVKRYYNDMRTYQRQHVSKEAKRFIEKLQQIGEVYIITAVAPEFMSIRIKQIKEAFPDFPDENIIMGFAKNLVHFDVTLDDAPHNILKSVATYPVLFRQPWNRNLSGVLAVNTFDEFLTLVRQIKAAMTEERKPITEPAVLALVGPSGSRKNELAKILEERGIARRATCYTTAPKQDGSIKKHVSKEEFLLLKRTGTFISTTSYAGNLYGTDMEDVLDVLDAHANVAMPLDICGAIGLKKVSTLNTNIIFCKQNREKMIESILMDDCPAEAKKYKLLSMEKEIENSKLCDYKICTTDLDAAAGEIEKLLRK